MTSPTPITFDTFNSQEGSTFEILFSDAKVPLTLLEVSKMGTGERDGGAFSLLFQGPTTPALQQSTYRVKNTAMGEQDIFLVPVAEKEAGLQYEAVFT